MPDTDISTNEAIIVLLVEGEESGESNLSIDDLIEIEFPPNYIKTWE